MRIAVLGGTGLIGSQVVGLLDAAGHDAVPHSPSTGLDLLSGQGLPEAVKGADVVVNLTNSPTFDDASPAFFRTSMDNLLAAAGDAHVGHAVVLSIVGADRVPDLAYYRAKVLQEDILKAGPVPWSVVRTLSPVVTIIPGIMHRPGAYAGTTVSAIVIVNGAERPDV